MVSSALVIAQEADQAALWPSDALSKVMRSDTPPTGGERLLLMSGARDEIVSFQVVFRPSGDIGAVTAGITDLKHAESDAVIRSSAVQLQWVLENELAGIKRKVGAEASWLNPRQRPLELCRRVVWSFYGYTREPDVMLDTRGLIAREIEQLSTGPLLIVQTSPPKGTFVPNGPRNIGVRGLVQPGAKVTINDRPVGNIRPSGYFLQAHFMSSNNPTIEVAVGDAGRKRTIRRTFNLQNPGDKILSK